MHHHHGGRTRIESGAAPSLAPRTTPGPSSDNCRRCRPACQVGGSTTAKTTLRRRNHSDPLPSGQPHAVGTAIKRHMASTRSTPTRGRIDIEGCSKTSRRPHHQVRRSQSRRRGWMSLSNRRSASPSDPLLDQHGHAGRAGHDLVVVAGRLADHVDDGDAALVGDEQAADPLADAVPDAALQAERGGDVDGDRARGPASRPRRSSPARSSRCGAGTGSGPGRCPSARPGAGRRARPAAGAGGRDRGSAPPARRRARGRGAPARAARSAPWAARSMPGRFRCTSCGCVPIHPARSIGSEADLPPDVADVVVVGRCRGRWRPGGAWRRCGGRTGRAGR